MHDDNLRRRAPSNPLVWLGDREPADPAARLGARFPATAAKERDFAFDPPRAPR